jgi:hypothetical protein
MPHLAGQVVEAHGPARRPRSTAAPPGPPALASVRWQGPQRPCPRACDAPKPPRTLSTVGQVARVLTSQAGRRTAARRWPRSPRVAERSATTAPWRAAGPRAARPAATPPIPSRLSTIDACPMRNIGARAPAAAARQRWRSGRPPLGACRPASAGAAAAEGGTHKRTHTHTYTLASPLAPLPLRRRRGPPGPRTIVERSRN